MRALLAVSCLLVLALAAPATAANQTVTAGASSWSPPTVNINAGDTVTWQSSGGHTLAFEDGAVGEGSTGAWSHPRTFFAPGTVRFRCTIHSTNFTSGMSGVVTAAPRAAPADLVWIGSNNDSWTDPTKWSGGPAGSYPGQNSGDTASIANGSKPVLSTNLTIKSVVFDGATSGRGGTGTLTVTSGGVIHQGTLTGGRTVFTGGTLTQDQGVLQLHNTATLEIGGTATMFGVSFGDIGGVLSAQAARLKVLPGGTASLAFASNSVLGSAPLIENAGTLSTVPNSDSQIDVPLVNTGTVVATNRGMSLRGGSSGVSSGDFAVTGSSGWIGFGTEPYVAAAGADFTGDGVVSVFDSTLTLAPGVTFMPTTGLSVAGGTLAVQGDLTVARYVATGSGGTRTGPGTLTLGAATPEIDAITLAGTGVTRTTGTDVALGSLQISEQAALQIDGTATLWPGSTLGLTGTGKVKVQGALDLAGGQMRATGNGPELLNTGTMVTSGNAQLDVRVVNQGVFNVAPSTTVSARSFTQNAPGATAVDGYFGSEALIVVGGGRFGGTGTLSSPLMVTGGTLTPGGGAGTIGRLTSTSTVTIDPGGTLEVDVTGAGGEGNRGVTYDYVLAEAFNPGGKLKIATANGFIPAVGDRYHVAGGITGMTGEFATFEGHELATRKYLVSYPTSTVVLDVIAFTPPAPSPTPSPTVTSVPTVTPVPTPTATATPNPTLKVPFTQLASIKSLTRCAARRSARLSLKPRGVRSATVKVGSKTVRLESGSRRTTLRRLPKGKFTLKLDVTLTSGNRLIASRSFRACRRR